MIPQDPAMLLSYANTWMRDHEGGFDEFVKSHTLTKEQGAAITEKLEAIGYRLDESGRRFC